MQLLIGMGRDPVTGEQLGRAYQQFTSLADRVEARVKTLDPTLAAPEREAAVAAFQAEESRRGTRRAVAGFDYTFSVPKSVSVLWGVADAGLQSLIADAHHAAVAEVIAFVEREVATTRVGATGPDGAVAQVDVAGVAATAFDHYDSRAGDPQLHTHVVISNKVKAVHDGRWRMLDGRPMHAAVVALSEHYNAVLADHLSRTVGVSWEQRDRGRDRNPAWEITGVSEDLIGEFSSRSRHIEVEKERLIAQYVQRHGREPTAKTVLKLRAEATLATRPEKTVRSLAELTEGWRKRAEQVTDQEAGAWAQGVVAQHGSQGLRADDVPLSLVGDLGAEVMGIVGEKRSTWRRWNLHAQASRQIMGWRFASTEDREAILGMVTDAAEQASLRLTPPELATSPVVFQRSDGSSRFRPQNSTIYSSEHLLEAEDRLLARADSTTGPTLALETVEAVTKTPGRRGVMLGDDQAEALAKIAVSGRSLDVLVGPAGAGKTSAMFALRRAWESQHGQGSVIGLAPSAAAAQILGEELGIRSENTAKWWHDHQKGDTEFAKDQLVIVDEASLAGTLALDRITAHAQEAGAKVLLVGDWGQLQSVDAGGAFSLLINHRDDAPELTDIHRFTHQWEKTTSLDLRHGRSAAIDTLAHHDRITGGEQEDMVDQAYTTWRTDTHKGMASILVAEDHQTVTELNTRARTDLIINGTITPTREIQLHNGTEATVGDTVITRRNDRRLRNKRDWVRNGQRWTITRIRDDGSVTVRRADRRFGAGITLPASYAGEHLDLGYAMTAHRAQGTTTDTAHAVITPSTTRENLYVAMTRGRHGNYAYVSTSHPDEEHAAPHPAEDPDADARAVLYGVLQHKGAEKSATETIAAEQDTWGSIAQLAAEYETIAQEAQQDRWASLLQSNLDTEEQVEEVLDSPAFGALAAELRRAEANHHDIESIFPKLLQARSIEDADDIAAVLHERVARATARPAKAGRHRQPPRLISGLIPEATGPMSHDMHQALEQRHELIENRAEAVLSTALAEKAPWAKALGTPSDNHQLAATWRQHAQVVAAYRDRYSISTDTPLGQTPQNTAQKLDAARAHTALRRAQRISEAPDQGPNAPQQRQQGQVLGL